ncbi:hypothetical protein [Geopseudomonas aromaticivorans]
MSANPGPRPSPRDTLLNRIAIVGAIMAAPGILHFVFELLSGIRLLQGGNLTLLGIFSATGVGLFQLGRGLKSHFNKRDARALREQQIRLNPIPYTPPPLSPRDRFIDTACRRAGKAGLWLAGACFATSVLGWLTGTTLIGLRGLMSLFTASMCIGMAAIVVVGIPAKRERTRLEANPNYLPPAEKIFHPIYLFAFALLAVLIGAYVYLERTTRVPLQADAGYVSGTIVEFRQKGMVIATPGGKRLPFVPLMPVSDGENPALSFAPLVEAQIHQRRICWRTASPSTPDGLPFAYDFFDCETRQPLAPEGKAPERYGLVGALDATRPYVGASTGFSVVTLLRYEDSTTRGSRGHRVNDPRRIMWLSIDGKEYPLRRSYLYGYPDGAYDPAQIGQRFCLSQHPRFSIRFDEQRRPVYLHEGEESNNFLWSCTAAQRPEKLSSLAQLYR